MGTIESLHPRLLAYFGPQMRPVDFRAAVDLFDPAWWDQQWPKSAVLMGIGLAHTGLDMSYRRNGARGMFAVDPRPFGGEDTVATDPGSVWVDPLVYQALSARSPLVREDGTKDITDWIGCFLNQLWWPVDGAGANWRHPNPRTTVWEENCEKGGMTVALGTVTYRGISEEYRRESDQNWDELAFKDSEGNILSATVQEILWTLAGRAAIYAEAWWHPVNCRRAVAKALAEFSADKQTIGLDSVINAYAALGDSEAVARLVAFHSAIVYQMAQHPFCWLTSRMAEHEGYQRKTLYSWLRGERALDGLGDLAGDIADATGGAVGGAWWILVAAGAAGLILYAYLRGKK